VLLFSWLPNYLSDRFESHREAGSAEKRTLRTGPAGDRLTGKKQAIASLDGKPFLMRAPG